MSASKEQKIVIGQEWQEDKYARRLMRVTEIKAGEVRAWSCDPDRVKLAMIKGTGKPFAEMKDYTLRSGWTLVRDAEGSQPRRIALVIARPGSAYPTTDTHCCGCPSLEQDELSSSCRVASIFGWESNITSRRLDAARRLPECLAAEVRS